MRRLFKLAVLFYVVIKTVRFIRRASIPISQHPAYLIAKNVVALAAMFASRREFHDEPIESQSSIRVIDGELVNP